MAKTIDPQLENLLSQAVTLKASDLHLVAGEPPIFRVKGALQRADQDPLTAEDIASMVQTVIESWESAHGLGSQMAIVEVPGVVEGRLCVTISEGAPTASIRILPSNLPTPASARVPAALLEAALAPQGLVVISGEAGSGKTTVAMILLEHVNTHLPARIHTIEEPVSFRLKAKQAVITQQSVGVDVGGFLPAMKAVLRMDPDVIFVGELRDIQTLEACVALAESGHLVITQVHASDPPDAIQRMVDVHPEELRPIFRRRLAAVLRAVSSQKLLPLAGKPGRTAAYGVLVPDQEMRRAICEGLDPTERTSPLPPGCQTLSADIAALRD